MLLAGLGIRVVVVVVVDILDGAALRLLLRAHLPHELQELSDGLLLRLQRLTKSSILPREHRHLTVTEVDVALAGGGLGLAALAIATALEVAHKPCDGVVLAPQHRRQLLILPGERGVRLPLPLQLLLQTLDTVGAPIRCGTSPGGLRRGFGRGLRRGLMPRSGPNEAGDGGRRWRQRHRLDPGGALAAAVGRRSSSLRGRRETTG
mmetsp:Transcript_13579/g.39118  ORF Transcript_13579/g.39118 Transcript_13579/m.39118 type:complete len:206 (-) Transcript_13579:452-1069(-)